VIEGVAKSTQSHRLKVLREAGAILVVPQGRQVWVSLRRDALKKRFPGLLDTIQRYQRQR
jgi:DNA-binding transcriptional ArsR family regulator